MKVREKCLQFVEMLWFIAAGAALKIRFNLVEHRKNVEQRSAIVSRLYNGFTLRKLANKRDTWSALAMKVCVISLSLPQGLHSCTTPGTALEIAEFMFIKTWIRKLRVSFVLVPVAIFGTIEKSLVFLFSQLVLGGFIPTSWQRRNRHFGQMKRNRRPSAVHSKWFEDGEQLFKPVSHLRPTPEGCDRR